MKNDGGPAFPNEWGDTKRGMSLRDYFAVAALPSMWEVVFRLIDRGQLSKEHEKTVSNYAAKMSYEQADAMLAERDK